MARYLEKGFDEFRPKSLFFLDNSALESRSDDMPAGRNRTGEIDASTGNHAVSIPSDWIS